MGPTMLDKLEALGINKTVRGLNRGAWGVCAGLSTGLRHTPSPPTALLRAPLAPTAHPQDLVKLREAGLYTVESVRAAGCGLWGRLKKRSHTTQRGRRSSLDMPLFEPPYPQPNTLHPFHPTGGVHAHEGSCPGARLHQPRTCGGHIEGILTSRRRRARLVSICRVVTRLPQSSPRTTTRLPTATHPFLTHPQNLVAIKGISDVKAQKILEAAAKLVDAGFSTVRSRCAVRLPPPHARSHRLR